MRPVGARRGTTVVQGSKVNPGRFPQSKRPPSKAELTVWVGYRRKKTRVVAARQLPGLLEQYARQGIRAVAKDQMSQDIIGETFIVRRLTKAPAWTYYVGTTR